MSYAPPAGDALAFSWEGAETYAPPSGDAVSFAWEAAFSLALSASWQSQTENYSLDASWPSYEGADGYALRLIQGGITVETVSPTGESHTFTGLAPETTYTVEVDALDGTTVLETDSAQVTTGAGLPGEITNLQHSRTTDSLTFTWDAASDADGYTLELSLDGQSVATQATTNLTNAFSGLEDGTDYDLVIYATNAQGSGPDTTYSATTAYVVPSAPINLRQFEERVIAVICRWDSGGGKVHDFQVELHQGAEQLYAETLPGDQFERQFPVPQSSTDYLLRVRAGNPAGWSAWSEATVHSEEFPIFDSRIAVMAATYLEDYLYPDSWGDSTDTFGEGNPESAHLTLATSDVREAQLSNVIQSLPVGFEISLSFGSQDVMQIINAETESENIDMAVSVGDFTSAPASSEHSITESDNVDMAVSVGNFSSSAAMYITTDTNSDSVDMAVSVGNFSSEVP